MVVKKTSPEYRPGIDPPCPSVAVNGRVIVRDGTVSRKVNTKHLRMAIAVIIAVTGVRMWFQVLSGR